MENLAFKKLALQNTKELIQKRIDDFEKKIAQLQNTKVEKESENVDLVYKSDNEANHEVSNKLAAILNAATRDLTRLELLEIEGDSSEEIEPGAIVATNHGTFFVSVGAGNFEIKGKEVMSISTKSPIFIKMVGMKKGDSFKLRDMNYRIEEVF